MIMSQIDIFDEIIVDNFAGGGGAFNRTLNRKPVMREVRPERKQKEADNAPLDGQISLEV